MFSFVTLPKPILRPSVLIISAVLLMACGIARPAPILKATATTLPTVIALSPTPTIPQSTTASALAHKIRLYHNQTATRVSDDQYSFSVAVDQEAEFIPKSIQIVEPGTNSVIGTYELFDQSEIESRCAKLMNNANLKFYETVLVDYLHFPQAFIARAYEGDFIFQIVIELSSGTVERIEKEMPDGACETHVS
ncbi:MAG TPA: hypothetical protein VK249_09330 [Anaerolineales bacterium]|nr:hypothetical protein [Anaerolineales bacterium]